MTFFDKELVRKRFSAHLEDYDRLSVVQRNICSRLSERMKQHIPNGHLLNGIGYEVGAGTGFMTKYLLNDYHQLDWYINDLVSEAEPFIEKIVKASETKHVDYIWGDGEELGDLDNIALFTSSSAMQWFNSIENYLTHIYGRMQVGGYLAFSIFGKRNFVEVRSSSGGVGLDYPECREVVEWGEKCGYEVLMADDYTETIYFSSPADVLSYIKQSGMNGNNSRKWTKSDFEQFCDYYNSNFNTDNGTPLTFNPLQFVMRKK